MTNGKLPTWFVVKWLEKHPTHTAKAPRTSDIYTHEANIEGGQVICKELGCHIDICCRSDWTIYNERGKRVRFKVRQPSVTVPDYGTLTVRDARGDVTDAWKALNGQLDVFIRERSR